MMTQTILKEPTLKDVDIVLKCKKYPEFRKELQEIEKAYDSDLNMSIYANLEKIDEGKYFEIMRRDKTYVNFYGYKMALLSEEDLLKVYWLWIKRMDEEIRNNPKRKYAVIYYHNMSASVTPFVFIRDIYKKLPIQYYALLDRIYVVESSFFLRNAGMFEFGRLYKLYSRRLFFVENLKQLSKIDEIRKNQIIEALPEILSMEQQITTATNIDKKKQSGGDKKGGTEQKSSSQIVAPKKQEKKDCLTIRLSQHKFDENNMPVHLMSLISTMRKYPQMMELEGIFRKSGSIEEEEEIIQALSEMPSMGVLKQPETGPYCGYAVAGVIKKIFTKLDHPIVPYDSYNKVMALQGIKEEDEIDLVKDIIYSLPTLNRNIILYVISFIRNEVLPHTNNKMNFYSMSVVLSPCFFRPEVSSLQDLLNSGRFASIINILFKKYEDIVKQKDQIQFYLKPNLELRQSTNRNIIQNNTKSENNLRA